VEATPPVVPALPPVVLPPLPPLSIGGSKKVDGESEHATLSISGAIATTPATAARRGLLKDEGMES
jgi:hypothetical protein